MTFTRFLHRSLHLWLALAAAGPALAQTSPDAATLGRVERLAARLANELADQCPVAGPGDQAAFDACRQGLYQDSTLRRNLSEHVLWGRKRDLSTSLKDTGLTQFAPDVLTGMYLPLFMFSGQHDVSYVPGESLYLIKLQVAFRNRLTPGQFPYPFWHDAQKWATYQNANEVRLWWDSKTSLISVAQFDVFGTRPPLMTVNSVTPPPFDGRWLWTDANGQTQPQVTVFDGLFRADNPYMAQLDTAYKTLALRLREGQCNECHVPSNPDKMKRLVLLQTPAHAGAEIKRVIKSVRADKMPRDEVGIEQPLDHATKTALLRDSEAFDSLYDAAKVWEANAPRSALAVRQGQGPRAQ